MADVVIPKVLLFFACDEILWDPETEKVTLTNPWHTVGMPPGVTADFTQAEIWLYAQVTGGLGDFYFSVHLLDHANCLLGKSTPVHKTLHGGIEVVELFLQMSEIPFPEPGMFLFQLMANHAVAENGGYHLRVLPGESI